MSITETMLVVAGNSLDYGLYELRFTVTMDALLTGQQFFASSHTYLSVQRSALVAALLPNAILQIDVGIAQSLCLSAPNNSFDPAHPTLQVLEEYFLLLRQSSALF